MRIATVAFAASLAFAPRLCLEATSAGTGSIVHVVGIGLGKQPDIARASNAGGVVSADSEDRIMSNREGDADKNLRAARQFNLQSAGDNRPLVEVQGQRGNEFVGVPRFEPPAGWKAIGSRTVAHASGAGRMSVDVGGRAFRKLHLITNGNSVLVKAVRISGRSGAPHVVQLAHDLQTGSSVSIDVPPSIGGIGHVEVEFTARSEGAHNPATLTLYGEARPAR